MSNLFDRLAARARGETPLVKPRQRSRYETGPAVLPVITESEPEPPEVEGTFSGPTAATSGLGHDSPGAPAGEPQPIPRPTTLTESTLGGQPDQEPVSERPTRSPAPFKPVADTDFSPAVAAAADQLPPHGLSAALPERERHRPPPVALSGDPTLAVARFETEPLTVPALVAARRAPGSAGPDEDSAAAPLTPTTRPEPLPADQLRTNLGHVSPLPATIDELSARRPLSELAGAAQEPDIHVTIGRVEVRAPAPPSPSPRRRSAGPKLTLSDYLKARNEARR